VGVGGRLAKSTRALLQRPARLEATIEDSTEAILDALVCLVQYIVRHARLCLWP